MNRLMTYLLSIGAWVLVCVVLGLIGIGLVFSARFLMDQFALDRVWGIVFLTVFIGVLVGVLQVWVTEPGRKP